MPFPIFAAQSLLGHIYDREEERGCDECAQSVSQDVFTFFLTDWPSQKLNTRKHPPLEATGETSKPQTSHPTEKQEQDCMNTLEASSICELPVPSSVQQG